MKSINCFRHVRVVFVLLPVRIQSVSRHGDEHISVLCLGRTRTRNSEYETGNRKQETGSRSGAVRRGTSAESRVFLIDKNTDELF